MCRHVMNKTRANTAFSNQTRSGRPRRQCLCTVTTSDHEDHASARRGLPLVLYLHNRAGLVAAKTDQPLTHISSSQGAWKMLRRPSLMFCVSLDLDFFCYSFKWPSVIPFLIFLCLLLLCSFLFNLSDFSC